MYKLPKLVGAVVARGIRPWGIRVNAVAILWKYGKGIAKRKNNRVLTYLAKNK